MRTPFSNTIIISGFCDNLLYFFLYFFSITSTSQKMPYVETLSFKMTRKKPKHCTYKKDLYIYPIFKKFDICQKTNPDTGTLWIFNNNPYKRYMTCQNIALKLQPSVMKNC